MTVVDVQSKTEFDALVAEAPRCAVHFWASWCEPSKFMDTVFAQLATENPSQKFLRVEAEEVADVSEAYDVSAVPYFLFFESGKLVDRLSGAHAPELSAKVSRGARPTSASPLPNGPSQDVASPPMSLRDRLDKLVKSCRTLLFMKGTRDEPRCGFSSKVVTALQKEGADFQTFDILSDQDVRQGMKEYSDWPTFPQLYHEGEFVGGCDIVLEMSKSGELAELLQPKTASNGVAH